MQQIFVMRHGKTDMNKDGLIIGHKNPSLSKEYLHNIKMIKKKLENQQFDAIYTSDLLRAYETAQIMRELLDRNIPIIKTPLLREIDYGELTDMKKEDAKKQYPKYHSCVNFVNPGGESFLQMHKRVTEFIKNINNALVITHAGCIRSIYSHFRNEPLQKNINMKITHSFLMQCNKKEIKIFYLST